MSLFPGKKGHTQRNRKQPGFTLIEVLVALSILTIVLGAIYSTFFLSHRAVEGLDQSMDTLNEMRRTLDILRRELESVFYDERVSKTLLKVEDRDHYGRQASALSFSGFSTITPGLSIITYRVNDNDGTMTLSKSLSSPYDDTETDDVDLIENIGEFAVEVKYQGQWTKTWDTEIQRHVPDEIRVTLSVPVKERQLTVFDIAKPRIGRKVS